MATYICTSDGEWGPATLGGTPTADDTVVVGYDLAVSGDAVCGSFTVEATGSLTIADGGTLTFSADSLVRGLNTGRADRLVIEAGGTLQHDGAGDVTLYLGGDWYECARFVANGTSGSRCTVRRKPGNTASHLLIANGPSGGAVTGAALASFAYCDFSATSLHLTYRHPLDGGGMIACDLDHCTIDAPREWYTFQTSNSTATTEYVRHRIVGSVFTGLNQPIGQSPIFTLSTAAHASGARAVTIEDNAFGRGGVKLETFNGATGAASSANWSIKRNVFEHGVTLGSNAYPFGDGVIAGNAYWIRHSNSAGGNYQVHGYEDDPYLFADNEDSGQGNPHFYVVGGTLVLRGATWDYRGPFGTDNGDAVDVQSGGDCTVTGGLILPATPNGTPDNATAGVLFALADGSDSSLSGRLTVDRCTFFTGRQYSGVVMGHAPYDGPAGRLVIRDSLGWGPGNAGTFASADSAYPITEDFLAPADFHHNAMYGLGTYGGNTVGGTPNVSLEGFYGLNISSAPSPLKLTTAPGFADATRNTLTWGRTVRGHSMGDDAADLESTLADLKADTSLIETLRTWVRAGYVPSNADLIGAASDGGTIGAMDAAADPVDPVVETGRTGPHNPAAVGYDATDFHTPDFGGMTFFDLAPSDNPLKELVRRVDSDPLSPYSDAIMACYQPGGSAEDAILLPGWAFYGSPTQNNRDSGFALNVVDSRVDTLAPVTYRDEPTVQDWQYDAVYPDPLGDAVLPADGRVQGSPSATPPGEPVIHSYGVADAHTITLDIANWRVYETYHTYLHPTDGWIAASGWYYDLRTGDWCPGVDESAPQYVPPNTHRFPTTLVNAAALPMLPLMLRYDEVYPYDGSEGEVKHAIGMTLPNEKLSGTWAWPALSMAYVNRARWDYIYGMTIPYGGRFRLKASWYHANVRDAGGNLVTGPDTPAAGWGQGALVILKAMKEYGLIVTDGGANFDLWAIQDSRWPWLGDLADLQTVRCDRFEVPDFEDDLYDIPVSPEVADVGVERTVTITCRLWERHPNAHPGYPDVTNPAQLVGAPQHWPYQYAVALMDPATTGYLGAIAPGETDGGYGLYARFTPGDPTVSFKITPAVADQPFQPFTFPAVGVPFDYGAGLPTLRTTATPDPAPAVGGGLSRRARRILFWRRNVL